MAVRTFRNPTASATTAPRFQPTFVPVQPEAVSVQQSTSEQSRREEAWRLRAHVAVILCLSLAMGIFGLAAG